MIGKARQLLVALIMIPLFWQGGAFAAETLTVGVHYDNRPWSFRGPDNRYIGVDVDIMKAVANQLGIGVWFKPMGFSELFEALQTGEIDAVASSITVTPDRLRNFDFTQPYYATARAAIVLTASGIKDLAGLSGKEVAVTPGTTNADWLKANGVHYGIRSVVPADSVHGAIEMLRSGEIAAYFGDQPSLLYELLTDRELAVIGRVPANNDYAIMLAKNSPWTARFDAALSVLKTNGDMAWIHRKWFGSAPPAGSFMTTVRPRP